MEEVIDRFLADREISIYTLLRTRNWIPVVGSVRVQILEPAEMETVLYTCLIVENIARNCTWTARMECYAPGRGKLRLVAVGRITHAYLLIRGPGVESELVQFDPTIARAIGSGME